MWSRAVFGGFSGTFADGTRRWSVKRGAAEDPGAVGKRMGCVDLAAFGGTPECLGTDADVGGRLRQIKPWFAAVIDGMIDWNTMMRAQRRHTLTCPAVAVAGY